MNFGLATLDAIHRLIQFACTCPGIEHQTVERELNEQLRARPIAASRIVWAAAVLQLYEFTLPVHEEVNRLHDELMMEFRIHGLRPAPETFRIKHEDRLINPPEISTLALTHIPEDTEILKKGFIGLCANWAYKELLACRLRRHLAPFTLVEQYARRADDMLRMQTDALEINGQAQIGSSAYGSGFAHNDGAADYIMGKAHVLGNGHSLSNGYESSNIQVRANGQTNGGVIRDDHSVSNGHTRSNSRVVSNGQHQDTDHMNGDGRTVSNGGAQHSGHINGNGHVNGNCT